MSDFQEFLHSRVLRHPTTWLVAALAGFYGGLQMYETREAKRAAGQEIQFPWLWLERTVDFAFGATVQVGFVLCAVWMVAGLLEHTNAWIRQLALIAVYFGILWLSQLL